MSAGRPRKNPQEPLPELAELSAWLAAALAGSGYDSVYQFLQRNRQFNKKVYGVRAGTECLTLPVMKALAAALGRPPGEVEPLWSSAKRAKEQHEQLHAATVHPSSSWETLPQPEPGVRYLLLAEADEAQLLPYQLLGIEPPSLPLLYVRQYLRDWSSRPQATGEPGDLADGTEREEVRPAAEVLSRHDYVLVTGGPGSGKTALVKELARRLARIWLREDPASDPPTGQPAVPLLIPVWALTDAGPFTSALASAVRRVYGMDMLTELRPVHFAGPVSGSRWLLIIDGLDEVVDRELRAKIIRAIRAHARADTPYRFVVTSRPLPEAELRPLRQEPFTAFSVEPFGRRELREFAEKWFATHNPATASEQSRAFVREIGDARLREAARNPLLATIAAVAKTRDPGLPLPASRVDLYGRFCGLLIGDEANGRTTLRQIREQTGEPGYRAAEWVYSHREELVTWLAERYLDGEPALLDAARAWIRESLPGAIGEAPKADDLRLLLAGTGVLMAEGADLRFTHHTLAEYLAARTMAGRMTADLTGQPDLKTLIDRGLAAAQETLVVFTLVLWGRAGGQLGSLLRHLLDGPPRQSLLAGRILGECGDTRPAERSQVIDRLMDMALGDAGVVFRDDFFGDDPLRRRGERDPDPLAAAPGEAFWLLGSIHGDSHVAAALRAVAASGELAIETRTDAAVALGRSSDRDGAVEILRSLPQDHTPPAARVRIAQAIIALDSDATNAAQAVLRTMSTGTGSPGPAARAAELLAEFGQPERAVNLAWSVIDDNDGAYPAQTSSAVRIILRYQAADGAAALLHVADGQLRLGGPMLRWILIELTRWGFGDRVIEFCRRALADPGTISWQWSSVAGGWAFAAGPSAITEIFRVLDERGTRYDEAAGEISLRLLETAHPDEAFEIAMDLMRSPGERLRYSHAPWIALAAAPAKRLPEVLSLIDKASVSDDYGGQRVLDELIRLGETGRAAGKAKALVLESHGLSQRAGPAMLKALRAGGELESLTEELARVAAADKYTNGKVPIIEALLELGDARHAAEMAREVITSQTVLGNNLARMTRVLTLSEGLQAADGIVTLLGARKEWLKDKHLLKVADCLASMGALAVGARLWLELLTSLSVPIAESFASCSSLLQSGQRTLVITTLRDKLNDGNLAAADRARLGALLSWAELRNPQENARAES
jgi:hypothetical protein